MEISKRQAFILSYLKVTVNAEIEVYTAFVFNDSLTIRGSTSHGVCTGSRAVNYLI